jgi:hypothetical protein
VGEAAARARVRDRRQRSARIRDRFFDAGKTLAQSETDTKDVDQTVDV